MPRNGVFRGDLRPGVSRPVQGDVRRSGAALPCAGAGKATAAVATRPSRRSAFRCRAGRQTRISGAISARGCPDPSKGAFVAPAPEIPSSGRDSRRRPGEAARHHTASLTTRPAGRSRPVGHSRPWSHFRPLGRSRPEGRKRPGGRKRPPGAPPRSLLAHATPPAPPPTPLLDPASTPRGAACPPRRGLSLAATAADRPPAAKANQAWFKTTGRRVTLSLFAPRGRSGFSRGRKPAVANGLGMEPRRGDRKPAARRVLPFAEPRPQFTLAADKRGPPPEASHP